jgi:hypothetical protein
MDQAVAAADLRVPSAAVEAIGSLRCPRLDVDSPCAMLALLHLRRRAIPESDHPGDYGARGGAIAPQFLRFTMSGAPFGRL